MKKQLPKEHDRIRILGVPVSAITMDLALKYISSWINSRKSAYVCVRDVHGIMRAASDPDLMAIHEKADMVTPDGMPLVWISRWRGKKHVGRVAGADLVDAVCALSAKEGWPNYFFGGGRGVAQNLAKQMKKKHSGLIIAGTASPPFGTIDEKQDRLFTTNIKRSGAKIVWVGLSTPKQEHWMADHVTQIPSAVLIGVGAAFDFHTGTVKRAPKWMQSSGFEWLHRLFSDPKRLWYRYLVLAPKFVICVLMESLGLRRK